jgi:hypothetical protein
MSQSLTLEEAENAYLLLVARRVLQFQREAEERGEVYHDMSSDVVLNNGLSARLRFHPCPGGYEPILWLTGLLKRPEDLLPTAARILGGPAEEAEGVECKSEYAFRRKKTA